MQNLLPVIYSDERVSVLNECLADLTCPTVTEETMSAIYKYGLLTKSVDWCYQNEWRLISLDDMLSDLLSLVEHEGFRLQTVGRRSSGDHDLLFILKAFDLDLRLHWPLGTVLTSGSSDFEHRFENAVFDSE